MIGRCFRVFAAATVVVLALVLFAGHASQPSRAQVNAAFVAIGTLPQVSAGAATPGATPGATQSASPAGQHGGAAVTV